MRLRSWSAGLCIALSLVSAGVISTRAAAATADPVESRVQSDLKQVTSLELPAMAARLVRAVYGDERELTALAIVRVVSKANPPALPSVIGAIGRIQPSLVPKLTAEAAKLQPKLQSQLKLALAGAEVVPPTPVGEPTPTTRQQTISGSGGGSTVPQPTPDQGQKKGHYKRPQGP